MSTITIGPGAAAGGLLVLGLVAAVGYGVFGTYQAWRAPDHFGRTPVGGALSIPMTAGGAAVIYHEGERVPPLGSLGITVTDPTGAPVSVSAVAETIQYDRNDVLGTAVARFTATDAGVYQLHSASVPTGAWIAVGRDIGRGVLDAVLVAGAIVAASTVLALLVLFARR